MWPFTLMKERSRGSHTHSSGLFSRRPFSLQSVFTRTRKRFAFAVETNPECVLLSINWWHNYWKLDLTRRRRRGNGVMNMTTFSPVNTCDVACLLSFILLLFLPRLKVWRSAFIKNIRPESISRQKQHTLLAKKLHYLLYTLSKIILRLKYSLVNEALKSANAGVKPSRGKMCWRSPNAQKENSIWFLDLFKPTSFSVCTYRWKKFKLF